MSAIASKFDVTEFHSHLDRVKKNQDLQEVTAAITMIDKASEINKLFLLAKYSLESPFCFFTQELSKAIQLGKTNRDFYYKATELLAHCIEMHSHSRSAASEPLFLNMNLFNRLLTRLRCDPQIEDLNTILKLLNDVMTLSDRSKEYSVFFEKRKHYPLIFFIRQISEAISLAKDKKSFYPNANEVLSIFKETYVFQKK